jgi:3-oxoacyl-[acyl-carrier protein] reductase
VIDATEFEGRVALVVGGARGIGAATCEWLANRGAKTYCVYKRSEAAASELKERLGAAGERLLCVCADVTDQAAVVELFGRVTREAARLDVLVNCAGSATEGLLLRMDDERVRASLRLNLEATIALNRSALPLMLRNRYGRIVNVGSVVASAGNAGQTVYAAAKAGVEGFTRSLAREVGSRGITVNCVAPGMIDTDMTRSLSDELRVRAVAATAVGRVGSAAEVASTIGFLCSEAAGYVTGIVLQVNGGMYM